MTVQTPLDPESEEQQLFTYAELSMKSPFPRQLEFEEIALVCGRATLVTALLALAAVLAGL